MRTCFMFFVNHGFQISLQRPPFDFGVLAFVVLACKTIQKTLDINGVFQVKNCGRLLFSNDSYQSGFTTLPRTEQGSDWVCLKRSLDLTDGFWSGNHVSILYLEIPHANC